MNAPFTPPSMGWCASCEEHVLPDAGGLCQQCDSVVDHDAAAALDEQLIAEAFARPRITIDYTGAGASPDFVYGGRW